MGSSDWYKAGPRTVPRCGSLRTRDTGLGRSDDDIDAWSLDVKRINCDGASVSARRTRLLVDDNADAAWRRDGDVRVGGEDWLARDDQADQFRIPGDGSLSTAAGGARVRFHDIGSNKTSQKVQVRDR